MPPLVPLELVWLIAVYANHARVVRLLCRAARDLRPERSVLHRCWSWMLDEDFSVYGNAGELLLDLYVEIEPCMWGPPDRRPSRASARARLRRPCPQRLLYREPLAHVPRYQERRVHEIFRIPKHLINHLRRNQRWQVLALV